MNDRRSIRARSTRVLNLHAWIVGAGWFVVAFTSLVAYSSSASVQDWVSDLPSAVQGAAAVPLLAAALPLAWPVYVALGWYEGGLAQRLRVGDERASGAARRILVLQALVAALPCIVLVVAAATAAEESWARSHLAFAWAPLALICLGHLWTARNVHT